MGCEICGEGSDIIHDTLERDAMHEMYMHEHTTLSDSQIEAMRAETLFTIAAWVSICTTA